MPCRIRVLSLWLTVTVQLGMSLACSPFGDPVDPSASLRFDDFVAFQSHQLTTDLVAVPEGLGLAAAGHGWQRQEGPEGGDAWLLLTGPIGRFSLFSGDGDLQEMELEISLSAAGGAGRQAVQVFFNGTRLDRLRPDPEWTRLSLEIPQKLVRQGINTLDLGLKERRGRSARRQLRLRRLRLRSASGRPAWPGRPQTIRRDDGLQLPVASFVELFVRVPPDGRLEGRYEFTAQDPGGQPVWAYVELLEESGKRRTLFQKRLYRSVRRPREVMAELSAWTGQIVRLRAGVTGGQNGVLRWHDLRLSGATEGDLALALPQIRRRIPPRSERLGRPDVLVILIDAARADAFSPWGGAHPTPAIERLAASGSVFSRALSPSPWTGQSVPSILTGLYPDTLGVGGWGSRVPAGVPTLAGLMAAAGYRTVLWSQHPFYSNHDTFRRGFEEFYRGPRGVYDSLPSADLLMTEDRPTFAMVHLIPPHAPYEPPNPFRGAYSSWYTGDMSVDAHHLNSFPRRSDPADLTADDIRYVRDRYLENAAFADTLIGRILRRLDSAGRYDDSLVVVLSDHGEAFMEHGRFLHTNSVHSEFLHVPLVIKWPSGIEARAAEVGGLVSLVDLVPTLADGLGLATDGHGFQGISLLPAALDGQEAPRPIYAITRGRHDARRPPRTRLMLDTGGWRILMGPEDHETRLYRSDTDPGESHDLALDHTLQTLVLRQAALHQWHWNRRLLGGDGQPAEAQELDPELLEQLEALGYLN